MAVALFFYVASCCCVVALLAESGYTPATHMLLLTYLLDIIICIVGLKKVLKHQKLTRACMKESTLTSMGRNYEVYEII